MLELTMSDGLQAFYMHPGLNALLYSGYQKDEYYRLYDEVQRYLSHGITVKPGDVVFDVGANIGLFSLYLSNRFGNGIDIYAFEPIPQTFDLLKRNADRQNRDRLHVFQYGLSDTTKSVSFVHYPLANELSNAYAGESKDYLQSIKATWLRNIEAAPVPFNMLRYCPTWLRPFMFDWFAFTTFRSQTIPCELKTVSQVMREQRIPKIDLLKIDVEKSELDILLGIENQDWPKIKQVAIEIHDTDNRLNTIISLLQQHGFNQFATEQEAMFAGSEFITVYAVRE